MSIKAGNSQSARFRLNNLVIASIGAAGSLNVDVTIAAVPSSWVGATGTALPIDADLTAGLPPPSARITSTTNLRLRFANPSAGAIDPVDTFDWDVNVQIPAGSAQQTI
jgi:hypothetical protein